MKKTLLYISCIAGIFSLASCSEKFDVAAPYKQVTVVTGFLDLTDTAQYIRIEKGFLDNDKSSIDMAKVADSSYFDSIQVQLKEMIPQNPTPVNVYTLPLVDMDKEGYPKAEGTFFTTPNYAYKFKQQLNPAHKYRLVITNFKTKEVDSAETAIIDTAYQNFSVIEFSPDFPSARTVSIASKNANNKFSLSGTVTPLGDENQVPAGIAVIESVIDFYYRDSFANTGLTQSHKITWSNVPADIIFHTTSFDYTLQNTLFYDFFKDNISPSTDIRNEFRIMDSFQVNLYAGSHDYYVYKQVTGAQNNGLTGGEIKPNYSNIKGGTVLGLYSTRVNKLGTGFHFEISPTLDSLRADSRTAPINFTRP